MLARYVPAKKTPLSFDDAASAMSLALASVLGETPATTVLALALAKTALETGRWSACWNGNWGNIKASAKYDGLYTCIVLNEVLPLGLVWFAPEGQLSANPSKGGKLMSAPMAVPEGHPQTRMRAFLSPSDGALDYVRFVAGGRYAAAWVRLLAGDAAGYVHMLKQAGYFTADETTYAKGVISIQREFVARLEARPAPEYPVPPVEEVREWLTRQDLAELDAAIVARGNQVVQDSTTGFLREASGLPAVDDGDSGRPPPPDLETADTDPEDLAPGSWRPRS